MMLCFSESDASSISLQISLAVTRAEALHYIYITFFSFKILTRQNKITSNKVRKMYNTAIEFGELFVTNL